MELSRKDFIKLVVVFGAGGVASACGGSQPSGSTPNCAANGAHDTAITGNHGHVLTVPAADFSAGVDKTYSIQGTATHSHDLTLTAAQFGQLKMNQAVTSTSTTTLGHSHDVTVGCM